MAVYERAGERMRVGVVGAVLACALVPVFARYRRWHLRWGATDAEVEAAMPGDDLVDRAPFRATRAITVDAPPESLWPWIVQIGFGRAGFYAYDLLDNLGRRSAEEILPAHQPVAVGDVAAPMTASADERTSFRVFAVEPPRLLGWHKPGSTWVWLLEPVDGATRTRLVVRLQEAYRLPWAVLTVPLMEVADFPMMRRQLLGLRERAERSVTVANGACPTRPPGRM